MASAVLGKLRSSLKPGAVYRRRDLAPLSSNIDRHLRSLLKEGTLKKLRTGLYLCPEKTSFGEPPAEEGELLSAFLKSSEFLVYSPNSFNSLGLGTTQLYNTRTVLNRKRHGRFVLNGRDYFFHRRMDVPKKLTKEVLLVELMNNMKRVAEDPENLWAELKAKLAEFDSKELRRVATKFGTYSTKSRVDEFVGAVSA